MSWEVSELLSRTDEKVVFDVGRRQPTVEGGYDNPGSRSGPKRSNTYVYVDDVRTSYGLADVSCKIIDERCTHVGLFRFE